MIELIGRWFSLIGDKLMEKANTYTATIFGGVTSIGYANIKTNLLQINWAQWSLDLFMRVMEVGIVGAVGAFSGLMVKYLFEKYVSKKEMK